MSDDSGESAHREPTDFLCLAVSQRQYICNLLPDHNGEHQAGAGAGRIVDRWPNQDAP